MATLHEFLHNLTDPAMKRGFYFSIISLLTWICAITISIYGNPLDPAQANNVIYALLGSSLFFSIMAMPRPKTEKKSKNGRQNIRQQTIS